MIAAEELEKKWVRIRRVQAAAGVIEFSGLQSVGKN